MAQTYLSRFLSTVRSNENAMRALFQELATFAAGELTRHADAEGNIPRNATFEIQRAIGERVMALFVAQTGGGRREPLRVQPDGSVIPLSPYARILWDTIRTVTRIPVEQHAAILSDRLPFDIRIAMARARRDPFAQAREVVEMNALPQFVVSHQPPATSHQPLVSEQVFRPNPLARYDAPHTWVDPNGHTLSDRIWNTAGDTRRRLDLFLEDAIRRGRGALDLDNQGATGIVRDLEAFLLPGRKLRRTNTPYGVDVSFDAMRLARTEISRAHARAAETSAAMNPFVQGLRVVLSRSHPKRDICDDAAAAGPWPVGEVPAEFRIPLHPQCLCHYQYELISGEEQQAIFDELRADIRRTRADLVSLIGPLAVEQFTELLLRGELDVTRVAPLVA